MEKVLKENGVLRLAVPNFPELIKVYEISDDLSKILGPLYGKWKIDKKNIYHKTVYDEKSLTIILEQAGFRNIRKWIGKQYSVIITMMITHRLIFLIWIRKTEYM